MWTRLIFVLVLYLAGVCGGELTSHVGTFSSPGFPNILARERLCEWTIVGSNGTRISLQLTVLDSEDPGGESVLLVDCVSSNGHVKVLDVSDNSRFDSHLRLDNYYVEYCTKDSFLNFSFELLVY